MTNVSILLSDTVPDALYKSFIGIVTVVLLTMGKNLKASELVSGRI